MASMRSRIPARVVVSEVREGVVRTFTLQTRGLRPPPRDHRRSPGGDREQNAQIIKGILAGEDGPKRDIVLMNAAAALMAGGKARDLKEGVALAAHSIDSRAAQVTLERLVTLSHELARPA